MGRMVCFFLSKTPLIFGVEFLAQGVGDRSLRSFQLVFLGIDLSPYELLQE